jgi:K+-transporting ATPase ATPase C chain
MRSQIRPAVMSFIALTLITGVIYPLLVTGIARVTFAQKASGSLIYRDGVAIGSSLIGQSFTDAKYFWSRPSATSPVPYAADAGSASNLGPTNPALADAVKQRIATLQTADPQNTQPVPVELVTTSASGLDPHISVAAAEYQVARVARARGLSQDRVRQLVAEHTEARTLGVLGEPHVNVLELNLALEASK